MQWPGRGSVQDSLCFVALSLSVMSNQDYIPGLALSQQVVAKVGDLVNKNRPLKIFLTILKHAAGDKDRLLDMINQGNGKLIILLMISVCPVGSLKSHASKSRRSTKVSCEKSDLKFGKNRVKAKSIYL